MAIIRATSNNTYERLDSSTLKSVSQPFIILQIPNDIRIPSGFSNLTWNANHQYKVEQTTDKQGFIIPEDGLYSLDGTFVITGTVAGNRSFVDFNITDGGIYTPTQIRSEDTQNMGGGDPTFKLSQNVYLKKGAVIKIAVYTIAAGTFKDDSQIYLTKIGEYPDSLVNYDLKQSDSVSIYYAAKSGITTTTYIANEREKTIETKSLGNKFTVNDIGRIYINNGIKKVKLSACTFIDVTGGGYLWLKIRQKNGAGELKYTLNAIHQGTDIFVSAQIPPGILEVEDGDYFYLEHDCTYTKPYSIRGTGSTYLTMEVVEYE